MLSHAADERGIPPPAGGGSFIPCLLEQIASPESHHRQVVDRSFPAY